MDRYREVLNAKAAQAARYLRACDERQRLTAALREAVQSADTLSRYVCGDYRTEEVRALFEELQAVREDQQEQAAHLYSSQAQLIAYTQSEVQEKQALISAREALLRTEVEQLRQELARRKRKLQLEQQRRLTLEDAGARACS